MSQVEVRVTAERCGAWWYGDTFSTSKSHARSLVNQSLVEIVGEEAKAIFPEYEDKSIVLDDDTEVKVHVWPEWMWQTPSESLLEAGITPDNLLDHSVEDLVAIKRIGERTAKKLLEWAEGRQE